jgi:hypothetical protein
VIDLSFYFVSRFVFSSFSASKRFGKDGPPSRPFFGRKKERKRQREEREGAREKERMRKRTKKRNGQREKRERKEREREKVCERERENVMRGTIKAPGTAA